MTIKLTRGKPQPIPFDAPDGRTYEMRRLRALSTDEQERLIRLHRQLEVARDRLRRDPRHIEAQASAMQALTEMIRLFGPTLPPELLATFTPDDMLEILQQWDAEQPELEEARQRARAAVAGEPSATGQTTPTPSPGTRRASSERFSRATRQGSGKRRSGSLRS